VSEFPSFQKPLKTDIFLQRTSIDSTGGFAASYWILLQNFVSSANIPQLGLSLIFLKTTVMNHNKCPDNVMGLFLFLTTSQQQV